MDNDGVEGGIVSGEEFAVNSKDTVVSSAKTFQAIESLIPEKYDGEGRNNEGKCFAILFLSFIYSSA